MAFPFFRKTTISSYESDTTYAGCYRYPDGRLGSEIRIEDTQPKIIVGSKSSGKTSGIILANSLIRTRKISNQFGEDTGPWHSRFFAKR